MSDADNYSVKELNLYSDEQIQPSTSAARAEHAMVKAAMEQAGIRVIQVPSPADCQDGIYTANWAFCSGDRAVMSRLPNVRQGEEPYARSVLADAEILGDLVKQVEVPDTERYSGQGDTLVCGKYMFVGAGYRSDATMRDYLSERFSDKYQIIPVQTIPALDESGQPVTNKVSGWADSYFYDIDLAMGVIDDHTIAWCPEAFDEQSQANIRSLADLDLIEVTKQEAMEAFACNLISTGHTVVMGDGAPQLKADIEAHGLDTITLNTPELIKGGGFIRCISLTLTND